MEFRQAKFLFHDVSGLIPIGLKLDLGSLSGQFGMDLPGKMHTSSALEGSSKRRYTWPGGGLRRDRPVGLGEVGVEWHQQVISLLAARIHEVLDVNDRLSVIVPGLHEVPRLELVLTACIRGARRRKGKGKQQIWGRVKREEEKRKGKGRERKNEKQRKAKGKGMEWT